MSKLNRREFLKQMGAAVVTPMVLSAAGVAGERSGRDNLGSRKPNIIFILTDDLGYGDLGCYGQKTIQTPYLDRMADEGIKFTQCYAGSTVCAPSRCCLMTGNHTGHARVRGNDRHPLLPEDVTVAEVLKDAGYDTAIIGKWGLGEPDTSGIPNRQGFDYWFGYLNQRHAHDYYPDFLWRNEEKVDIPEGTYSHDLFTQESLDYIKKHQADSPDNPFFLYMAYTIPHAFNEGGAHNGMPVPSPYPYADKDWPKPNKNQAAMISRMDRDVGRLFNLLWELGIDENTVVFFASDNGPHSEGGVIPGFFKSGGPLKGMKRDMYEGGIRVPMMVRWPGVIKPGQTSGQVWSFWDFLPTAAEIGGGKTPDGIDGISMLPALTGGKQKNHEYLYWEFHEGGFKRAIVMDNWKFVWNNPDKPIELYDLDKDIGESTNLADEYPDVVEKGRQIFENARTNNEHWPGPQ